MNKNINISNLRESLKSHIKKSPIGSPRTSKNIGEVYIGNKIVNGSNTGSKAIVFLVNKKKALKDLDESEIIPSSIEGFPTDVIEGSQEVFDESFQPNPTSVCPSETNQAAHLGYFSANKGGISIGLAADASAEKILGNTVSVGSSSRGTLGLVCIDKQDNTLVGLTNNHVLSNYYVSSSWGTIEVNTKTTFGQTPINVEGSGIKGTSITGVGSPNNVYQAKKWVVQPSLLDNSFESKVGVNSAGEVAQVGVVKRVFPFTEWNAHSGEYNLIDAAICTVENPLRMADTVSFNILGHPHQMGSSSDAIRFATTKEIDNLNGSEPVVKCGAGFGAVGVGASCKLGVHSVSSTASVSSSVGAGSVMKKYIDTIIVTGTVDPSTNGDSGSVYTAKIDGSWKVIGLHFGGGTRRINGVGYDIGIGCRIDHVSELLGVKAYDGSSYIDPSEYYSDVGGAYISSWSADSATAQSNASAKYGQQYISLKGSDKIKNIFANGSRYTQAGKDSSNF